MERQRIEEQLREIFATVLEIPPEEITSDLNPDGCEKWDSLNHIHILTAIDQSFGIALELEAQMEIMSFELAIDVVAEELNG